MSIALLLDMTASSDPGRQAIVCDDQRVTAGQLDALARGGAGVLEASGCEHVVYVGLGGLMLPVLMFAAARSGRPFTPLNYRLSDRGISELIARLPAPLVVADEGYLGVAAGSEVRVVSSDEFVKRAASAPPCEHFPAPDDVAVVLFTSGTTSAPKAVELTHGNLTSYVTTTVDFASADPADAALICVPPYHIAGVGAALSNLYAGRKMVYLTQFDPYEWVSLVEREHVTNATVVPTMLDRVVGVLAEGDHRLPTLRNLAYGGAKVNLPLLRKALELLPNVGFVNAYGLTETSSTIAILTPEDHRDAVRGDDERFSRRLGSVGRPVPGIEIEIRDDRGSVVGPGTSGELFVRGGQVASRYSGLGSALDEAGWFATRDLATVDEDGYLFLGGRSDDTIIRGGENIAPAEIEDVLVEHPDVGNVVVVGAEDDHWGQAIVAVVIPAAGSRPDPDALRQYVRDSLRGSRTPDRVVFVDEFPTNATGKILRREIVERLTAGAPVP